MMQTLNKLRINLAGCLLLALCCGSTMAADEFRMNGKTGDILAGSRMMVVNGTYYYVDRKAPIHADWTKAPMTLEQIQPGMHVGIQVSPKSADSSLPHIKELWVYAE